MFKEGLYEAVFFFTQHVTKISLKAIGTENYFNNDQSHDDCGGFQRKEEVCSTSFFSFLMVNKKSLWEVLILKILKRFFCISIYYFHKKPEWNII